MTDTPRRDIEQQIAAGLYGITTPRRYDYVYGCHWYNMLWGATGAILRGQVIPAADARSATKTSV